MKTSESKADTKDRLIWKIRYENLKAAIQEIHELANQFRQFERNIPNEPWSLSDEFFISNDLEVVDNEEYALQNWGEGKYFKVVKSK
jgi:hypothetical protein